MNRDREKRRKKLRNSKTESQRTTVMSSMKKRKNRGKRKTNNKAGWNEENLKKQRCRRKKEWREKSKNNDEFVIFCQVFFLFCSFLFSSFHPISSFFFFLFLFVLPFLPFSTTQRNGWFFFTAGLTDSKESNNLATLDKLSWFIYFLFFSSFFSFPFDKLPSLSVYFFFSFVLFPFFFSSFLLFLIPFHYSFFLSSLPFSTAQRKGWFFFTAGLTDLKESNNLATSNFPFWQAFIKARFSLIDGSIFEDAISVLMT